jgi:hypothetical protein
MSSLWCICHLKSNAIRKINYSKLCNSYLPGKSELSLPESSFLDAYTEFLRGGGKKEIYSFREDVDDKDHHSVFYVMFYDA